MPTQQDITGSHALIIEVFRSFRPELMRAYGSIGHENKADGTPVSALDIKIETVLKQELLERFPVFGFRGEETPAVAGSSSAVWYVDPIDSTRSFVQGLPYCSNMAGLVVDGRTVASVVYHFAADELFTAFEGRGAYRNGQRIQVTDRNPDDSCVYADAYSYLNAYRYYQPDGVKFYAPLGATGYFLTRLAQGSIQGVCYLRAKINRHDVIPGALLVLEAGGEAVAFSGQPFDYTSLQFMMGTKSICDIARRHQAVIATV